MGRQEMIDASTTQLKQSWIIFCNLSPTCLLHTIYIHWKTAGVRCWQDNFTLIHIPITDNPGMECMEKCPNTWGSLQLITRFVTDNNKWFGVPWKRPLGANCIHYTGSIEKYLKLIAFLMTDAGNHLNCTIYCVRIQTNMQLIWRRHHFHADSSGAHGSSSIKIF